MQWQDDQGEGQAAGMELGYEETEECCRGHTDHYQARAEDAMGHLRVRMSMWVGELEERERDPRNSEAPSQEAARLSPHCLQMSSLHDDACRWTSLSISASCSHLCKGAFLQSSNSFE